MSLFKGGPVVKDSMVGMHAEYASSEAALRMRALSSFLHTCIPVMA
jgi:hypothetical protein